jgi:uncharacterized coiled-coil protein SlyX
MKIVCHLFYPRNSISLEEGGLSFNAKHAESAPQSMPVCYASAMEERIIQLESLSAMQDETIRNLHNELFEQQKEIGRLRIRLEQLEQKLTDLTGTGPVGGDERPPHW